MDRNVQHQFIRLMETGTVKRHLASGHAIFSQNVQRNKRETLKNDLELTYVYWSMCEDSTSYIYICVCKIRVPPRAANFLRDDKY